MSGVCKCRWTVLEAQGTQDIQEKSALVVLKGILACVSPGSLLMTSCQISTQVSRTGPLPVVQLWVLESRWSCFSYVSRVFVMLVNFGNSFDDGSSHCYYLILCMKQSLDTLSRVFSRQESAHVYIWSEFGLSHLINCVW